MSDTLFPSDLPDLQWCEFSAADLAVPVSGLIFSSARPPCCGMPLGGLATGCVDLDARGVWGWSSLFNPIGPHPLTADIQLPRRLPAVVPVLGLAVGGRTWVLAAPEVVAGGGLPWCTEPYGHAGTDRVSPVRLSCPAIEGVEPASAIRLWGHYPVADFEYETAAPVSVGLRAWAPFVPGDAASSNIPGAVFEVRVRNPASSAQRVALALDFPGPSAEEAGAAEVNRIPLRESLRGMLVVSVRPTHGADRGARGARRAAKSR